MPPDFFIATAKRSRIVLFSAISMLTGPKTFVPTRFGIFSVLPAGPNLVGSVKAIILFLSNFR